jgi:hypothetical protein
LGVAELAVDVVDTLSEMLPRVELEAPVKSRLDEVPGDAPPDAELVGTAELVLAVGASEVVTTLELEMPELVLIIEPEDVADIGKPVLELEIARLEVVAGRGEENELEGTELEPGTPLLELEASPDGTTELEVIVLGLNKTDEVLPPIELGLAAMEIIEEL